MDGSLGLGSRRGEQKERGDGEEKRSEMHGVSCGVSGGDRGGASKLYPLGVVRKGAGDSDVPWLTPI